MPGFRTRSQSGYRFALAFVCLALTAAASIAWAQTDGDRNERPAKPPATDSEFGPMDNEQLGRLLVKHFPENEVIGGGGRWEIDLSGNGDKSPADTPGEGGARGNAPGQGEQTPSDRPPAAELNGQPPEESDAQGDPAEGNEEEPEEEGVAPDAGERLPAVMIVLTDERANRMRLMMPIRPFDPNNADDLRLALITLHANYDRALDARYAIQHGVLWSVFIHPLESLTPDDLTNAINQVRELRRTTGTTFSSSGLLFGGRRPPNDEREPPLEPDNPNDDVI